MHTKQILKAIKEKVTNYALLLNKQPNKRPTLTAEDNDLIGNIEKIDKEFYRKVRAMKESAAIVQESEIMDIVDRHTSGPINRDMFSLTNCLASILTDLNAIVVRLGFKLMADDQFKQHAGGIRAPQLPSNAPELAEARPGFPIINQSNTNAATWNTRLNAHIGRIQHGAPSRYPVGTRSYPVTGELLTLRADSRTIELIYASGGFKPKNPDDKSVEPTAYVERNTDSPYISTTMSMDIALKSASNLINNPDYNNKIYIYLLRTPGINTLSAEWKAAAPHISGDEQAEIISVGDINMNMVVGVCEIRKLEDGRLFHDPWRFNPANYGPWGQRYVEHFATQRTGDFLQQVETTGPGARGAVPPAGAGGTVVPGGPLTAGPLAAPPVAVGLPAGATVPGGPVNHFRPGAPAGGNPISTEIENSTKLLISTLDKLKPYDKARQILGNLPDIMKKDISQDVPIITTQVENMFNARLMRASTQFLGLCTDFFIEAQSALGAINKNFYTLRGYSLTTCVIHVRESQRLLTIHDDIVGLLNEYDSLIELYKNTYGQIHPDNLTKINGRTTAYAKQMQLDVEHKLARYRTLISEIHT